MGTQSSGQAIDALNNSDVDLQCVGGAVLALPTPPGVGAIGNVIGVNAFQTPPGSFVQPLSALLNASSATTTITATVNLGDTLILYVHTTAASTNKISSITDSFGNTWSLADTYNPASQGQVTLWSAFNAISSGSITITITLAGATGNAGVAVGGEYFGVLWQNGDFAGTTGTSATLAGGSISASFANTETPTTVTVAFGYGANGTLIPTPFDVNAYGYFYTQRAQPSTNYSFTDVILGGNPSSADAPAFKPQWTQASSGAYVTANAVFYAQPVAAQTTLIANTPAVEVFRWGNSSTALAAPTAIGSVVTSGNVITVTASLAVNTTSLRAESNYGTAPSAVAAMGVNAYVTNQLTVVGTGTFAVQIASNSSVNVNQWDGTALGAPTAMGTPQGTGNVINANAALVVEVSGTLTAVTGTGTSVNTNITNASLAVTGTFYQATQPVDGALTNNNAAPGATLLGVLGAIAETAYTTVTYTTGDMVLPVCDLHGAMNQDLQAVGGVAVGTLLTAASTAAVATQPSLAVQLSPSQPQLTTPLNVTTVPATTGGWSTNVQTALTDSAVQVKSSAGQLGGYALTNLANATVFFLWYNSSPTVGSTTPIFAIGIPSGAAANVEFSQGIAFSSTIYVIASTSLSAAAAPSTACLCTTVYK